MNEMQEQGQQGRGEDNDRAWAKRMADEREKREVARYEALRQIIEVTQAGVAKAGVDIEDVKAKVDALFEKANPPEPTSAFGKFIAKADAAVRTALPFVTVGAAAVATGYGAYRGGKAAYGYATRKKPDATAQPVGEPVAVPKR